MKLVKFMFSRFVIVGVILLMQVAWFLFFLIKLTNYSTIINSAFMLLSVIVVLWIVNKKDNPAYKLAWIIPILLFPILGGFLYIMMGNKKPTKKLSQKLDREYLKSNTVLSQDQKVLSDLEDQDKSFANQAKYLLNTVSFPIYENTSTEYFKSGEDCFEIMSEELEKAEHFIFMEYFIIKEGIMWDSILKILEKKARQGLDVRVLYDDFGCLTLLPFNYYQRLEAMGIKCQAFNHYIPIFSIVMNNRDHRKMTIIDGHVAFTGGMNLADEYINIYKRFGYWKDAGIMIKGDATWSFTVMFLHMWNGIRPTDTDYSKFKPHVYHEEKFKGEGYIQPYGDTPLDDEAIGENVYINIIQAAKDYIYIFTPYLIIDNEMMTILCLAAKKGVDVRIVTPGIPDKKLVYLLTQSYYRQLVEAGVKIYQYMPGFIHSKCFVCDDEIAAVGTINMDYRSLYLHFECGVLIYKSKAVMQVKEDVLETLKNSRIVTEEFCKKNIFMTILQAVLRAFAPLI